MRIRENEPQERDNGTAVTPKAASLPMKDTWAGSVDRDPSAIGDVTGETRLGSLLGIVYHKVAHDLHVV